MDLKRFWRHVLMNPVRAAHAFPATVMDAIQREIAAQEKRHGGEVFVVVEAELTSAQLWRDLGSRDRAREVFALQGVWNTEDNNGVLIYVLLADRGVEIVADRGIDRRVAAGEWEGIVHAMEAHFRDGRYEEGALTGVRSVSDLIATHFPVRPGDQNELADRPVVI
ncbi:MAG TPA: TPM domain-containing protein [Usitatibacter sp.]|nr:TPM domain-containing protein [Usitatibacter sp.]